MICYRFVQIYKKSRFVGFFLPYILCVDKKMYVDWRFSIRKTYYKLPNFVPKYKWRVFTRGAIGLLTGCIAIFYYLFNYLDILNNQQ